MKAHIEAYGCSLNRGEALEFESVLRSSGWEIVEDPDDSDFNAIATCIVIEKTELEMIKRIKELKRTGKPLVVTGCMVTALRNRIEEIAPDAKLISPAKVNDLCVSAGIIDNDTWKLHPLPGTGCHTIPIATGCLGNCAYCITKTARGEIKSRSLEDITDVISRIDFSHGTKEIQLTAQDSAAYGSDIGSSLPDLLNEVVKTEYDIRIRIGMMNPSTLGIICDEMINAYSHPKIFKFLHLPVQSGSDHLLAEMGRGYKVDDFQIFVDRFRSKFPDMTLSTDIIVGYPGESEEDHEKNVSLISKVKPEIVNITRFSSRPKTKAALNDNKVPSWKAKNRSRELTKLRFDISLSKNEKKIGRTMDVVVTETGSKGTMIARGQNYEQIILSDHVRLGQSLEAEIIGCSPIHLIGKISNQN